MSDILHKFTMESFRQPNPEDGSGSTFDSFNFLSDNADWQCLENKLKNRDWKKTSKYVSKMYT